jgi:hypothetical protein
VGPEPQEATGNCQALKGLATDLYFILKSKGSCAEKRRRKFLQRLEVKLGTSQQVIPLDSVPVHLAGNSGKRQFLLHNCAHDC